MSSLIKNSKEHDLKRWALPSVQGDIMPSVDAAITSRPPTAEEIENIHKQAYDEGFNLGRKEGRALGYKQSQQRVEQEHQQRTETLKGILNHLAEPLSQLDDEVEKTIIDMVALLAKHLVRRELKTNEGEIIGVVRHVMGHLPISARHPRIHLNPEDLELVKKALAIGDEEESWRLEPDPLISRGGCLVESQSSFIDATVEARLAAQVSQMFGGERQSDHVDSTSD